MSDKKQQDPIKRLVDAYESMLERVHDLVLDAEEKAAPVLKEALQTAREKAVELGELTREEAEKISGYVERDMRDAADFIAETGQDFRDWYRFDWQLIEDRLLEMFASVADQTSLQLRQIAEDARHASLYHTGEITGPGTLACVKCGEELHFKKTGHIPPCPACQGSEFRRAASPKGVDENLDQGDVDGD